MTQSAWIVGVGSTVFSRQAIRSHRDLADEAVLATLLDAGVPEKAQVGSIWFASAMADYWGQAILRGQATLLPLMRNGLLPERVPIYNVEAACASGSVALQCAVRDVLSGEVETSLAVGVEKLFDPNDRYRILPWFQCGSAPFDLAELLNEYREVARKEGAVFEPGPGHSLPMDTYGLQAQLYMRQYGLSQRQLAMVAAKNRWHAAMNPKAHHQSDITVDAVLADKPVSGPLTRAMCAPLTDGAAAAMVVSERQLGKLETSAQARAVRVRAMASTGGKYRSNGELSLTRQAVDVAYARAGVGPEDIDVAEVHDATAFCEIFQSEMLRFCPIGEGGALLESGATRLGGTRPINVSGGLIGKGHPIAATGLAMLGELVMQLRGECGPRQVNGARLALHQNGGGVIGLEEALCVIAILERPEG